MPIARSRVPLLLALGLGGLAAPSCRNPLFPVHWSRVGGRGSELSTAQRFLSAGDFRPAGMQPHVPKPSQRGHSDI